MIARSLGDVFVALLRGASLHVVVPIALARVEREPLARARDFDGDLLRGLMEVPGRFWVQHPRLYDRYREVIRRSAALRPQLPPEERMQFWSALSAERGTTPSLPRDG